MLHQSLISKLVHSPHITRHSPHITTCFTVRAAHNIGLPSTLLVNASLSLCSQKFPPGPLTHCASVSSWVGDHCFLSSPSWECTSLPCHTASNGEFGRKIQVYFKHHQSSLLTSQDITLGGPLVPPGCFLRCGHQHTPWSCSTASTEQHSGGS